MGEFAVRGTGKKNRYCGKILHATYENILIRIDSVVLEQKMITRYTNSDNVTKTTNEVALMSFVAFELEELIYQLYKKTWLSICRLTQQRQIWINKMATDPSQAYIAARMLLGVQNIMAHPAGQFMSIYECEVIESYFWEPTKECYKSIPIKYKKYNMEHKLYLIPATKDIVQWDTPVPCTNPIKTFLVTKVTNETSKQVYSWNGSALYQTNVSYTKYSILQMMDAKPNITHMHLVAARLDDATDRNFDTLGELSTAATGMLVAISHATNTPLVTLDTDMIENAANITASTIKHSVHTIVDNIYPVINWIEYIVTAAIFIVVIIITVTVIIKLCSTMKHRRVKTEIATYLHTLNQSYREKRNDNPNTAHDDIVRQDDQHTREVKPVQTISHM
jgi:hypothetical protein